MKDLLKTEEYTRSIPNSKWLQNVLENGTYGLEEILSDKEWRRDDESVEGFKNDLKISMDIFEQCINIGEGEPVSLTEEQLDYLLEYISNLLPEADGRFLDWPYPETCWPEYTRQQFHDSLTYYINLIEAMRPFRNNVIKRNDYHH